MMTSKWAALAFAVSLTLALPSFGADEPERPWAKGVPKDRQAKAIALFREGNTALKESLFPKAAAQYRDALQVWDHPAVHYNLALALVNLDQPLEVHEHLTAALKFGAAPLDDDKFQQAQRYLALIERQLTKVKITCNFSGASVRLDGRPLFTAPGEWEGQVRAGPHTMTASLEGYLSDERSMVLAGGDSQKFELRVFKSEELTEYRRAFSAAIPWTALGVGVAAAGAGVALHLSAASSFSQYDQEISDCATGKSNFGCFPNSEVQRRRADADSLQSGAIALYAVGGAAVVASAILFYVGRPIAYQRTVNVEAPKVTVLPLISPTATGAIAAFEF
jgi:tetratricopeptide (TPR) repeat protein